jgi:hypothetical protein
MMQVHSGQDTRIYAVMPSNESDSKGWNPKQGDIYLFIYQVRAQWAGEAAMARYCTLLAAAPSRQAAEQIAINEVHQQGWHILRTDTATRLAPEALIEEDAERLQSLKRFGVHFTLS